MKNDSCFYASILFPIYLLLPFIHILTKKKRWLVDIFKIVYQNGFKILKIYFTTMTKTSEVIYWSNTSKVDDAFSNENLKKIMNTYLSISWIRDTPASLDTVILVLFVVIPTIALEIPILPCQKKPRYKGTEGFLCSMRQGCVWYKKWSDVQCTLSFGFISLSSDI